MRNSSEFVKEILHNKERDFITPSDKFVPFLVRKYLSGVSPEHCMLTNMLFNPVCQDGLDEQELYDLMKMAVSKAPKASYQYFTKPPEKKGHGVDVEKLSRSLEISKQEINDMLEYFPDLIPALTEDREKILKSREKTPK